MSRLEENNGAQTMTVPKPLGIGRGIRASKSLPPAPVPREAPIAAPQKVNTEVLHENREFLRDIARKFLNDGKKPHKEDISAEFEKRTGIPLEEVALSLGFGTEDELFDRIDLNLTPLSQNSAQGRCLSKSAASSVSRICPTNQVNQASRTSLTRNRKSGRSSRRGSPPMSNSRSRAKF